MPVNIAAEVDINNSDFCDFEDPINNAPLDLHWRRQKKSSSNASEH
jgi:hypothetical protein